MEDKISTLANKAEEVIGENNWASKYGIHVETSVFKMHPFCWCEKDDCGYCAGIGAMPQILRDVTDTKYRESRRLPNFLYKPTGFKVWWYKYIGRSQETNDASLPKDWFEKCVDSLEELSPNYQ